MHPKQPRSSIPLRSTPIIPLPTPLDASATNPIPVHHQILNPTPAQSHQLPTVPPRGPTHREYQQCALLEGSCKLVFQGRQGGYD